MKHEFVITVFATIFVTLIGFSIFYGGGIWGISGRVVDDLESGTEEIVVTEIEAEKALKEIEGIRDELAEEFSVVYIEDKLIEAEIEMEKARSKAILEDEDASYHKKLAAQESLRLVDEEDVGFENVLKIKDEIVERKSLAYLLSDSIVANAPTETLDAKGEDLWNELNSAFEEERYSEAEEILVEFKEHVELKGAESATLGSLRENAKTFVQRNWYAILIVLVLAGFGGWWSYKKTNLKRTKKKISKMKVERKVLLKLMAKAQTARFKTNKISGLVYNIRMKKYKDRMTEIKDNLPVLEGRLKKIKDLRQS